MRMMPWAVRVMVGTEHGHLHLLLMKSAEGLVGGLGKGKEVGRVPRIFYLVNKVASVLSFRTRQLKV